MDSLSSINNASDLHNILNKEANLLEGIDLQDHYDRVANRQKTNTLGNFAKLLLAGTGIGLGTRGVYGMLRLLGRHDEEEEDPEEPNVVYGRVPVAKAAGEKTALDEERVQAALNILQRTALDTPSIELEHDAGNMSLEELEELAQQWAKETDEDSGEAYPRRAGAYGLNDDSPISHEEALGKYIKKAIWPWGKKDEGPGPAIPEDKWLDEDRPAYFNSLGYTDIFPDGAGNYFMKDVNGNEVFFDHETNRIEENSPERHLQLVEERESPASQYDEMQYPSIPTDPQLLESLEEEEESRTPNNEADLRAYLDSWQAKGEDRDWEDIHDDIPWREDIDIDTLTEITDALASPEPNDMETYTIPLMLKNMAQNDDRFSRAPVAPKELAKESVDTHGGSRTLWTGLDTPLSVAGAGLGLAGGWKLMDYLMDKRRKSEADEELASAKEEYEEAIIAASRGKAASDQVLGQELDKLFDACMDKSAEVSKQAGIPETVGGVGGLYGGLFAVPSMALAAILSYPFFSKRQRKKLLEKARKKREREKIQRTPLPIRLEAGSLTSLREEEEENSAAALNISPALDFEDSLDRV